MRPIRPIPPSSFFILPSSFARPVHPVDLSHASYSSYSPVRFLPPSSFCILHSSFDCPLHPVDLSYSSYSAFFILHSSFCLRTPRPIRPIRPIPPSSFFILPSFGREGVN